jgi:hypothetical protein
VTRPRRAAAFAVLAALAAAPAAAYERTVARGTLVPLAWPVPLVPWHLNDAWPSTAPCGGEAALDAVRQSFVAWEQPCSDLQLLYAGNIPEIRVGMVGSSENLVVFREGWCSSHPEASVDPCYSDWDVDCGSIYNCFEDHTSCPAPPCADRTVVALTSVLYDPVTGRIVDADIEVNGWSGGGGGSLLPESGSSPEHGWYFTCEAEPTRPCVRYGDVDCTYMDLRNTLTHEVGHFIGLRHPCGEQQPTGLPPCSCDDNPSLPGCPRPPPELPYNQTTMYPNTDAGDVEKRSLSPDDVAGVCAVYASAGGGCGCGSGGASGAGALLLGALALRGRRARQPGARS